MKGGEDAGRERALDELAALDVDLEVLADHRFRRSGAQRDDDVRFYRRDLALESRSVSRSPTTGSPGTPARPHAAAALISPSTN